MAMSVGGGGEGQSYSEINMTPLIDVMLVLLIIFIITLPNQTHAVKIDNPLPPPPNFVPPPPPEVIDLTIDFDGDATELLRKAEDRVGTKITKTRRPRAAPALEVGPVDFDHRVTGNGACMRAGIHGGADRRFLIERARAGGRQRDANGACVNPVIGITAGTVRRVAGEVHQRPGLGRRHRRQRTAGRSRTLGAVCPGVAATRRITRPWRPRGTGRRTE